MIRLASLLYCTALQQIAVLDDEELQPHVGSLAMKRKLITYKIAMGRCTRLFLCVPAFGCDRHPAFEELDWHILASELADTENNLAAYVEKGGYDHFKNALVDECLKLLSQWLVKRTRWPSFDDSMSSEAMRKGRSPLWQSCEQRVRQLIQVALG